MKTIRQFATLALIATFSHSALSADSTFARTYKCQGQVAKISEGREELLDSFQQTVTVTGLSTGEVRPILNITKAGVRFSARTTPTKDGIALSTSTFSNRSNLENFTFGVRRVYMVNSYTVPTDSPYAFIQVLSRFECERRRN